MGWPAGKPRGPRKPKDPLRAPVIEEGRDPATGRVVVQGRNGEMLTRKRTSSSDIFHIPPNIIPEGTDYQWNCFEVLGRPETANVLVMRENGWRPVPAGRHVGMFMPEGYPADGEITREGQRLEERPMALTLEAKAEERAKATGLMSDSKEQLGLVQKLPPSFASSQDNPTLRRMEKAGTSRSVGPAPDIARPRLTITE